MADNQMSKQNFQEHNIKQFQADLVLTSAPVAQNLPNFQTNKNYAEIFIDFVKEETCLWDTAFWSYKYQTRK